MYYRFRIYFPLWGRFSSTDPMEFVYGPNLWAYIGNDPLLLNDPFGLDPDPEAVFGRYLLARGGDPELGQIARDSCSAADKKYSNYVVSFASGAGSGLSGIVENPNIWIGIGQAAYAVFNEIAIGKARKMILGDDNSDSCPDP